MNWDRTDAEQKMIDFVDPGGTPGRKKPRLSDLELLEFIAERFRELGEPPGTRDLDPHRTTITTRFGPHLDALRLAAYEFLTEKERKELYVWRCRYCSSEFGGPNGRAKHEQSCRRKENRE